MYQVLFCLMRYFINYKVRFISFFFMKNHLFFFVPYFPGSDVCELTQPTCWLSAMISAMLTPPETPSSTEQQVIATQNQRKTVGKVDLRSTWPVLESTWINENGWQTDSRKIWRNASLSSRAPLTGKRFPHIVEVRVLNASRVKDIYVSSLIFVRWRPPIPPRKTLQVEGVKNYQTTTKKRRAAINGDGLPACITSINLSIDERETLTYFFSRSFGIMMR